jgi:hypothetical protein
MQSITVSSGLTFKPYYHFIFRQNFLKPLPLLIVFFALINLFLLSNYFLKFMYFELKYPWFQMALVLTVFVVTPLYFYYLNKKHFNNTPSISEVKHYEITEEAVTISNHNSNITLAWNQIYRVSESRNFIIIYFDYATAYFINKAHFKSVDDIKALYKIIKSKPGLLQDLLK